MPHPQRNHVSKNYSAAGGEVWRIGGTLELGEHDAAITIDDDGHPVVTGLATEDPGVAGRLWLDGGLLAVSAGPKT